MPKSRSRSRRSVKSRRSYTKAQCRSYLSRKIRVNMREFKKGRWVSPKQAIAISFSQTQKKYPGCQRFLKRRG
jgi:hypothetical protein